MSIEGRNILRYKRFLQKNQWELEFLDYSLVGFDFLDRKLKYLCQSVNLPTESFETNTGGWDRRKYIQSVGAFEDITVTFFETESFQITDWYNNWVDMFYDRKKKIFTTAETLSGSPKMDAELKFFTSVAGVNVRVPSKVYTLEGLLPKKFENITYTYTDGGEPLVTLSFSVDNVTNGDTAGFVNNEATL